MTEYNQRLGRIGLQLPEILLPASHIDISTWPVVACDQFTSKKAYWEDVASTVQGTPSTGHLIYPECYLADGDSEDRITAIHRAMDEYVAAGVFQTLPPSLHLVVRELPGRPDRTGIMIAVDLEEYDFSSDSVSPIRPTEGTIVDRIPARKAIRAGASLELPHVMVLIDDPERSIVEPIAEALRDGPPIYSTPLMKGGGSVTAYRSDAPDLLEHLVGAFERIADPVAFKSRYNSVHPFFVAIGDGNHSLAAAKSMWEDVKPTIPSQRRSAHPARFAMVEAINLYDDGIIFEPIHRLLFGVNAAGFVDQCCQRTGGRFSKAASADHLIRTLAEATEGTGVGIISENTFGVIELPPENVSKAVELVQLAIDEFIDRNGGDVDYVHDLETILHHGSTHSNAGLVMPGIEKTQFFPYIIANGCYPRKSFSLGESTEKRYYLEARRIR